MDRICREIRSESDVPVFMLTARVETNDEVFGFELGVDDYIKKPFSPRSLVARVKALEKKKKGGDIINAGALTVNRTGRFILLDGEKIDLPPKEYELLLMLYREQRKRPQPGADTGQSMGFPVLQGNADYRYAYKENQKKT